MINPIEYQKSWIALNNYVGCDLGCKYCILSVRQILSNEICSPKDLLKQLSNYKYFKPGKSFLTVNNYSDPLIGKTKAFTFKTLELLDKMKFTNVIGIITKAEISEEDMCFFNTLRYLKVHFFISISLLPQFIEPVSINWRLNTLRLLEKNNYPTILYFRPIIQGYNSNIETFKKIISIGRNVDAIVISGIKLPNPVINSLKKNKIDISKCDIDPDHKKLSINEYDTFLKQVKLSNCNTPVFRKTSCAISYLNGIKDYNSNFVKNEFCSRCIYKQQIICLDNKNTPNLREIEEKLKYINIDCDYLIENQKLILSNCELTLEEETFLKHQLKMKIVCTNIKYPDYFKGELYHEPVH